MWLPYILAAGLLAVVAWVLIDKAAKHLADNSPLGPLAMGAALVCVAASGGLLYAGLA